MEAAAQIDERARAACDAIAAILMRVPGAMTQRSEGPFQDFVAGRTRTGCLILTAGTFEGLRGTTGVEELLPSRMADEGWRRDPHYDADGPDGTSMALRKGPVLCLISVSWDGGDDSDPSYKPEDWFKAQVSCAIE